MNLNSQPNVAFSGSPRTAFPSPTVFPERFGHPYVRRGAGKARSGRGQNTIAKSRPSGLPVVPPPMNNLQFIQTLWTANFPPRQQWFENPKSILNNHCQMIKLKPPVYDAERVVFTGYAHPYYRVHVRPLPDLDIYGVGDDPIKKEAEKLAALSACLQLGLVNAFEAPNPPAQSGTETFTLPDQSPLSLGRARAYLDFYCKKFRFNKPDISYEYIKKGRGHESWAATLFINGSKIGVGNGNNKKEASNQAHLDTVVYLAECDADLWNEFRNSAEAKDVSGGGTVPEIVFRLSNEVEEDLRSIVHSLRNSELYQRAKTMLESDGATKKHPSQLSKTRSSRGIARAGPGLDKERLQRKSQQLVDRLADYQTQASPGVAGLRQQRSSLPVTSHASLVLSALATNPVTILMAATGSGKTTQVPQLILDEATMRGEGARCNVICTQPRRIAAISVAQRVANERNENIGQSVGYQVRFEAKPPTPDGSILFCTTGVFLRRLQNDMESSDGAFLDSVTHIVVDEVHERDIETDLLLFCLRRVLKDRQEKGKPETKVLLMSATVNPTLFERYFSDSRTGRPAPVISVPGRSYPVTKHYLEEIHHDLLKLSLPHGRGGWVWSDDKVRKYLQRELQEELALDPATGKVLRDNDDLEMPYALIALVIAWVLSKSADGHILVFLPGWQEIKGVQNVLFDSRQYPLFGFDFNDTSRFEVHVLHSAIPVVDQQKVFTPPTNGVRRVILSTNIAETSVTIPDVVFVVDTGKIKEKRFDPQRHLSSLITAWVGTSNLNQRAGRAGRHRPGDYYGLLSHRRYNALHVHSTVEMKRTDLSNLVMHVKALNFPHMEAEEVLAQTIEPPESERVSAAMSHLQSIGALDRSKDLTALGRVLLQLPVEAQIGKLLLLGSFFKCLGPALNLAAILTNRDPFLSPPAAKAEADRIKSSWAPLAFRSDPLASLAAFSAWSDLEAGRDIYRAHRFATENFLSKPTLAQISQVKSHLLAALWRAGVLAISGGGGRVYSRGPHADIPSHLNKNSESLPLLAALIAVAVAPNFAVRKSTKLFATEKDRTCFINLSSVNSHKKEAAAGEDIPLQNERQVFAFGEKSLSQPRPGEKGQGQMTLRSTTRLDPMGYMLFGARRIQTYSTGLRCDGWLPITGSDAALDDVERLKEVLDASLLRVFDGLQAQIWSTHYTQSSSRKLQKPTMPVKLEDNDAKLVSNRGAGAAESLVDADEQEEEEEEDGEEEVNPVRFTMLNRQEIRDLERLTEGVVTLLNRYSEERLAAADQSQGPSRPDSRTGNATSFWGSRVPWGEASGHSVMGGIHSRPGSSLAKMAMAGAANERKNQALGPSQSGASGRGWISLGSQNLSVNSPWSDPPGLNSSRTGSWRRGES